MNPALVFLAAIVLIAIFVTWWLMHALKRDHTRATHVTRETNVEALRIERSELDRDRKLGLLHDSAHEEATRELEVRVLREAELDRTTASATPAKRSLWASASFATLLPVSAIGVYLLIGAPHAVIPEVVRPPVAQQESQMDELFRVAEERLKAQPNDAKGWYLLARARASVGQFDAAMKDYEKLVALTPNDADAWADFADAAAGASEGKVLGRPLELVGQALAIDPKQPKALLLRGTHEIQVNDLAAAEKTFTLAKALVDPSTGFASIADNALKDIAARRGAVTRGTPEPAVAPASALASLAISLSPEALQAASRSSSAAVFIVVRAVDRDAGPPLAAKKIAPNTIGADGKISVTLGSSDAMIGGSGLAPGSEVQIEARLSLSGQPQAQPGDFRSAKARVRLAADASVALVIDQK